MNKDIIYETTQLMRKIRIYTYNSLVLKHIDTLQKSTKKHIKRHTLNKNHKNFTTYYNNFEKSGMENV